MCGIFGALARLPDPTLDRVSRAMAHRGPDADGRYVDDDLSLVHRRLSIIDLTPTGAQPMRSADGDVIVVFNGEIYNHHLLRGELGRLGHTFRGRSDTEAIVEGYRAWGEAVVEKLDGMFAIAIWDRRRKRLLLARDRTGKKPLFYAEAPDGFRFGSTVATLHESGVPRGIDLASLPYLLAYGYVPAPRTLHAGCGSLEPGQLLILDAGKPPVLRTYWTPRFTSDFGGGPAESYTQAARAVRQLVTAAIERRLESDVPLGAFLSGGIDSTIVVGVMSRLLGQRCRTFSIDFAQDPRYDETHYARQAAQAFGTDHTEFVLEPTSFDLVEDLVRHHDGPFGDSSAIPTHVVSKLTRQHVTVALTGDGGDELFCGYSRFLAAEASELVPQPLRSLASRLVEHLPSADSERSLLGKARRFLGATELPLADRLARWNSFFAAPQQIFNRDTLAALGAEVDLPILWQRTIVDSCRGSSTLSRVLEHNFRTYLPFDLLIKADRASMMSSLETRSPFLDTALIEYVSKLPADYLRRGTDTKRILKFAFADLLPESIQRRGKMGFGVPLGTWFRGDLKGYLESHFAEGARLYRYLDRAAVRQLFDDHQAGRADHGQRLWLLLTLEVWLRQENLGA